MRGHRTRQVAPRRDGDVVARGADIGRRRRSLVDPVEVGGGGAAAPAVVTMRSVGLLGMASSSHQAMGQTTCRARRGVAGHSSKRDHAPRAGGLTNDIVARPPRPRYETGTAAPFEDRPSRPRHYPLAPYPVASGTQVTAVIRPRSTYERYEAAGRVNFVRSLHARCSDVVRSVDGRRRASGPISRGFWRGLLFALIKDEPSRDPSWRTRIRRVGA